MITSERAAVTADRWGRSLRAFAAGCGFTVYLTGDTRPIYIVAIVACYIVGIALACATIGWFIERGES